MVSFEKGYAFGYTTLCLVIVIAMLRWVFNSTTIHPEYNLTLDGETTPIFGPVPLQRDIGTTRDGSGVGTPSDITDNLNQMVKGTYYDGTNTPKPSSNVCNDTLTCFPDNKQVNPHLCSTTNCDSLWNIMKNTTPKSGTGCTDENGNTSLKNCTGMTGVNIALKDETDPGYLKNQIRHLLCKLASQNVYKYKSSYGGFNMAMLTMSGIENLNGWHDRTSPTFIIYIVSIIIVSSLVLKMITLKLWEAASHNNTPSLFKLLLIGSTGAEKNWSGEMGVIVEKVLYISLSFFMYFFTIKYITTSILYIDAIETGNEETDVGGSLLHGYRGAALGGVLVPLVLFILSTLLKNKTNHISVYITGVQLTLIGLYTSYMFYVAKHATENSAGLKLDLKEGTGLQWEKTNSSPKGGGITESNSGNPILTNLKNFAIMAGVSIILFIGSLLKGGNSSKQANKVNTKTVCVDIIKQFKETQPKTILSYELPLQRIMLTFVSILLMIIYIVLAGTNVFVGICYPQIYIILLVFQRLIITNLVAFDEKDWHRNWHPILFPMLSKTISLLLVKEDYRKQEGYEENLLGTSNYKVFGRGPISMTSLPFFSYPSNGNFLSNATSSNINSKVGTWGLEKIVKKTNNNNKIKNNITNIRNLAGMIGGNYKKKEIDEFLDIISKLIKINYTTNEKRDDLLKIKQALTKLQKKMESGGVKTKIKNLIIYINENLK